MTKIRQFNAPDNQGARITMDRSSARSSNAVRMSSRSGGLGLRQGGRRQLMQAGAFANVQ